jgi:hypothetical protein
MNSSTSSFDNYSANNDLMSSARKYGGSPSNGTTKLAPEQEQEDELSRIQLLERKAYIKYVPEHDGEAAKAYGR